MWVPIRLPEVVSESQGQGLGAEKAKGSVTPKSLLAWEHWEHSSGTVLTSAETRYVGRCRARSWVEGDFRNHPGWEPRPQQHK